MGHEVEKLRQELHDEKNGFCQQLQKIEGLVSSLSSRDQDLAAKVEELSKEKEALATQLAEKQKKYGYCNSGSASTHSGVVSQSSAFLSSPRSITGPVSEGAMSESAKQRHARDLLK